MRSEIAKRRARREERGVVSIALGLIVMMFLSGCAGADAIEPTETAPVIAQAAGAVSSGQQAAITGQVVETMATGGYTYVQVDTGQEKIWAAAPQFSVAVGDTVTVPPGAPMRGYHSKTLNRTFDMVYFVAAVQVAGASAADPRPGDQHSGAPRASLSAVGDVSGVEKAEGGSTIAEVFDRKSDLSGKEVTIRGKVVKYSPRVMGKNWIHLRDGTAGAQGGNDLTVTTSGVAALGDVIVVRGMLSIDRDFGYGYKYEVMVEDASIVTD